MKNSTLVLLLLLTSPLFGQQQSAPEIPYRSDAEFFKLPATMNMGEAAGVAQNSKGHLFVFCRGHQARVPGGQLIEFDQNGDFVRTIGDGMWTFPHAVRLDADDNIWVVDEGANIVVKMNRAGQVLMVLGRVPELVERPEPGAPRPVWTFARPTDVAFGPAGDIFVADGYDNSRVVKCDKEGNLLKAWGKRGDAPGEFHTVHTIIADKTGHLYVGDRENNRVQVFDYDGNFLKEWTHVGAPWALCITPTPNPVIFSSDSVKGRIYKLNLDGHILGAFGMPGKMLGQFGWVHAMSCSTDNVLYTSELLNWRVQKLVLQPAR